jgi:hypothetical protein
VLAQRKPAPAKASAPAAAASRPVSSRSSGSPPSRPIYGAPAPTASAPAGATSQPYVATSPAASVTQLDRLVAARLEKLSLKPAPPCSDAVFLRRAYLDVIGTLPTEDETRAFLADKRADKRSVLIDRLLERPEFAEYWAMKWCDVLRVKAEFPINLWPNAAQAYHHWIRASLRENKPYDRFARELLTADGSNFRSPAVNFYRAVQGRTPLTIAHAVAITFMGTRAADWPKDRQEQMAAFFSQIGFKKTGEWKEEIVYRDPVKAAAAATQPAPVFPDGKTAVMPAGADPREVFADWLVSPENPWFAKAAVNRVWAWLLGRGIIHECDDIRPDNPPSNPELLAYLQKEFVASKYDLKHVYRLILNSRTYQSASVPPAGVANAGAMENFACYPLRRMEAEVLADALCQITGVPEKYSSAVPEPFTFIPEAMRSISLPDGSISSAFLELFGRPPRDTGLESERNNRVTAGQRLHMLNSTHVAAKIEQGPRLRPLLAARPTRETATRLYLIVLSRYPTEDELATVAAYSKSAASGREAAVDLVWALVNSDEFLFRH